MCFFLSVLLNSVFPAIAVMPLSSSLSTYPVSELRFSTSPTGEVENSTSPIEEVENSTSPIGEVELKVSDLQ